MFNEFPQKVSLKRFENIRCLFGNKKRFYKLFWICSGQILLACSYQNHRVLDFCVITLSITVSSRQNCPAVQKLRSFSKIPLLVLQNNFSNRCTFLSKHQILSILMKVTGQVPCSFHSKNLNNIICTQTQPLFSFYCKCFQSSTRNITLCENKVEASEKTKKVSIRLFSFLMKVTV